MSVCVKLNCKINICKTSEILFSLLNIHPQRWSVTNKNKKSYKKIRANTKHKNTLLSFKAFNLYNIKQYLKIHQSVSHAPLNIHNTNIKLKNKQTKKIQLQKIQLLPPSWLLCKANFLLPNLGVNKSFQSHFQTVLGNGADKRF